LSDVARESGRNVRQCKSKLNVLPDIAKESKRKQKGLSDVARKIFGCCLIKLRICQALKDKLEGISDAARES
jgi:hypothetical protein